MQPRVLHSEILWQIWSYSRWVDAHSFEECVRQRLRACFEFGPQYLLADSVLAQRLRSLAKANVAAHYHAVSVFTTHVVRQQLQGVPQGPDIIGVLKGMVGETC